MESSPGFAHGARPVRRIRRGERATVEILGIHCEWKITEAETDGHYCVLEMHVPPGAGVPLHQHASQETFLVTEGEAEFARLIDGEAEWFRVGTGGVVDVPSWAMHAFRNPGDAPARILLTCAAGMEGFFHKAGVPVEPGAPLPSGPPTPAEIERVVSLALADGQRFASRP